MSVAVAPVAKHLRDLISITSTVHLRWREAQAGTLARHIQSGIFMTVTACTLTREPQAPLSSNVSTLEESSSVGLCREACGKEPRGTCHQQTRKPRGQRSRPGCERAICHV
ncbi:hypothetical protein NDU88_003099 [Pleurodeles waltl]|uniref:Uncharacterized protein n=1 Tax=Pleurodeles waltl TaxID=8319 RepID=A0AAV7WS31_PLEWA|nr:hypothetical protein NDU88_003099 [Pleurodeles waltl]